MFNSLTKNNGKTPKKIQRIDGLLTLSSSNKKKISLKNLNKNHHPIIIEIHFNYGQIRQDLFAKFAINIFEYILYDRMAIPIPFGCLNKMDCSFSNEANKKKLLQTFTKLKLIFNFLIELFIKSNIQIHSIALLFGDSLRFAREIFIINLEKLNIFNEQNMNRKCLPFLTLRYMINNFYKRLLNEIPEEMPQLYTNQKSKINSKNILFTVKISAENIDQLRIFIETYSKENHSDLSESNFQLNIDNTTHRLGSIISRITHFKFDHYHPDNIMLLNGENFEIYRENDDEFDEIIEEKIIISNSAITTTTTNDDNDNDSESIDNLSKPNISTTATKISSNEEYHDVSQKQSTIDEMNSFWVQICSPIRCVDKI